MAVHHEMRDKAAVVTGAARGIGRAFAHGLLRQGVNVVAGDVDESRLNETVRELSQDPEVSGEIVAARMDVRFREEHQRAGELARERFGALHYWINNAGSFPESPVLEISSEELQVTMATNVESVLYGAQIAAELMPKPGGSILNVSSVAAFTVRKRRGTYGVSKAATDHLTRFLAVELGPLGVRVNAIAPGFVATEMTAWLRSDPDALDRAIETIPLRRVGSPDEMCDAGLFLLSDAARYITGHTLVVDGGSRYR